MPEINLTDNYNPNRGNNKCWYCEAPIYSNSNWKTVGTCQRHDAIFLEDFKNQFRVNRLKELIDKAKTEQINESA